MMNEIEKAEIVERLKTLIMQVVPEAAFVAKYGGTMVEAIPGEMKSQFCGVFAYKNHVSLEFTNGCDLKDSDKILEGSGKFRRHIKFAKLSDIEGKQSESFLRQAAKAL